MARWRELQAFWAIPHTERDRNVLRRFSDREIINSLPDNDAEMLALQRERDKR